MNQDILDELQEGNVKTRPTFVLVLCILTFVGSALSLFQAIYCYFIYFVVRNLFKANVLPGSTKKVNGYINLLFYEGSVLLISTGLCILGALWMFSLKKKGFYVYLVGQILPFLIPFYLLLIGASKTNELLPFLMFALIISVFPIAFIIMYSLNLKHMK